MTSCELSRLPTLIARLSRVYSSIMVSIRSVLPSLVWTYPDSVDGVGLQ